MKKLFGAYLLVFTTILTTLGVLILLNNFRYTDFMGKNEDTPPMKIGVVLRGSIDDAGWNEAHYSAFEKVSQNIHLSINYKDNVSPDAESVTAAVDEMIRDGARIVFLTSEEYKAESIKLANQYPAVYFYHAGGNREVSNLASYYARIYQIRYLSGIAAGMMTKQNEIAYIAAKPTAAAVSGINAFTLGARAVNPQVTVHVRWTDSLNDEQHQRQALRELYEKYPIDIMAYNVDGDGVVKEAEKLGIKAVGFAKELNSEYPKTVPMTVVIDWEDFYTKRISECSEGEFRGRHYWCEFNNTPVKLKLTEGDIPAEALARIDEINKLLMRGCWDVFYGPIYDNKGSLRVKKNEAMSDWEIINKFDWFVQGVECE